MEASFYIILLKQGQRIHDNLKLIFKFFALCQGLTDSFLMLSRNIRSVKQSLFVKVEKLKKIIRTDVTYDKHEIMVTVNVTPMRDNPQPT